MPIIAISLIVLVLLYAMLSIYLKKVVGLFIAASFHIVLGIVSLPSIGLFVLALAAIELVVGLILIIRNKSST